ncbi:hypothetical protein SAMN05216289_102134 [Dokdonella immobilis]|uniref:Uncharacterized protein n=2 Tax=Dokdonella immobilis TaxID=578942 RepID=A0A1I4VIK9_9GAMM|nr:hypothetical protein SAMN05216289_102134 [Dokdonella immobilis]
MGRIAHGGGVGAPASEVPAISLEIYAHSVQEENLLTVFREIPTRKRSLLISLAEEFAAQNVSPGRKRR